MDQEPHIQPATHQHAPTYHGFWPVLLLGLSILLIFVWEIRVNILTRQSAQQLQVQQVRLVDQAKKVETGLEKLVRGLVDLAGTDDEAKRLVTKFGIKINDPTVPTSTPSP